MKLIFLDIGGVLVLMNDSQTVYEPDCVKFAFLIQEATNSKIIITSDLRYQFSNKEIVDKIESETGYHLDIIDSTKKVCKNEKGHYVMKTRGQEIEDYLKKFNEDEDIDSYVIIDDLPIDDFKKDQREKLILTNTEKGLRKEEAFAAIRVLNEDSKC